MPYLISSHPGSTLKDGVKLAEYLKQQNCLPEQVQDFYPTPGTASTCMFYTEIDPFTGKSMFVPKEYAEKKTQRALLQYGKPENREIVLKALKAAGREDLIGFDKHCLVRPGVSGAHVSKGKRSGSNPKRMEASRSKKRKS